MTHLEDKAQRLREQVGTRRGRKEGLHETTDLARLSLDSKPPSIFSKPFEETHGRSPNPFLLAPLLATSRPVQRKDFIHDAEAQKADWKEWTNLDGI